MVLEMRLALILLLLSAPLAAAPAVHDVAGKVPCLDCHVSIPFHLGTPTFHDDARETCTGCHRSFHGTSARFIHPVDKRPSTVVPPDMPLDSKGKMTCITCHIFHEGYKDEEGEKRFFLRRTPGKIFCYSCH